MKMKSNNLIKQVLHQKDMQNYRFKAKAASYNKLNSKQGKTLLYLFVNNIIMTDEMLLHNQHRKLKIAVVDALRIDRGTSHTPD